MNFIGEYQISNQSVAELLDYWHSNKSKAEQGLVGDGRVDEGIKKSLEIMIAPSDRDWETD